MARTKRIIKPLDTIWECPDALWENVIVPVLNSLDPPAATGRKRIDQRQALNGIIYQLRSGCQWNHLPRDFGDDASIHRTFQRWIEKGVLSEIWAVLVGHCEGLGDVDYTWQSADGFMGKARFGGTKSAKTPRIGRKKAPNDRCWWTVRVAY
jgi:putative transposase